MAERLRLGLIGCGRVAERFHVPAIREVSAVALIAVADPLAERAAAIASLAPGCTAFDSAEQMIAAANPQALIITSPPDAHLIHLEAALVAGLPALIEKPLSPSLDGLDALAEHAAAKQVPVMIGYNRRFWPSVARLRSALSRQSTRAQVARAHLSLITDIGAWLPIATPADVLDDLGTHQIDLARFLFAAEVSAVSARMNGADQVTMRLVMDAGFAVECRAAHADSWEERVEIQIGDRLLRLHEGSPRFGSGRGWAGAAADAARLAVRRALGRSVPIEVSFRRQLEHFVRVARREAAAKPGLSDGIAAVGVAAAVRRSNERLGEEIVVP